MKHNNSGKIVLITQGQFAGKEGKIYNKESPKEGKLLVHFDNETNILISSYKCQIIGHFDNYSELRIQEISNNFVHQLGANKEPYIIVDQNNMDVYGQAFTKKEAIKIIKEK